MHEYLRFFGTNNQQKVDHFLIYERDLLDRLNNLAAKCAKESSNLEEKTAKMARDAQIYAEEERVKDFYKIKDSLIEINKKQKEAGIQETTIFNFFKNRPEYSDLLELEKNK